ncbi:CRISPR-associated protein Cas10 [Nostoc sp. LEGE 06077]|uniref:Cas10/Cmr2 second palm domain-containing protein n=1 Tax=Nostoc sp. LEGE 06077 TaxID=915325 RepID=UPI00187DF15F|nr:type III-B CRISPR-associated protein Cas10/Cmr2 [Nostoc sp. LEGE 06077]MBE9209693.1 CRISPR-associated protein Cas10 [Nostoc sp. LEGE 06077]
MSTTIYTAITFAPTQEFIEKSWKLRDLYGSSFILSYLARAVCEAAKKQGFHVVSPAIINVVEGIPNQIIIRGAFQEKDAIAVFKKAWKIITRTCQQWMEKHLKGKPQWRKEWELWTNHAWEFFWVQGESIRDVWCKLHNIKLQRNWIGINWQGESSMLSGVDAIAYFGMGSHRNPTQPNLSVEAEEIRLFYKQLSQLTLVENVFVDESEQLSIPELIKRLITFDAIAKQLNLKPDELPSVQIPENFRDLNRLADKCWTGWFQGNCDKIVTFLTTVSNHENEEDILNQFSERMLNWGKNCLKPSVANGLGQIIYAGSDDFLGVFYRNSLGKLTAQKCLRWFYGFPRVWRKHEYAEDITASIGFVWAAPRVPQSDVLQHCREAEKSAKDKGRDRIALRILFNSGNWLEWVCPWWFLQDVLESYRDRNYGQKWTHIYDDVAMLESRHAFDGNQSEVALALFEVYFGSVNRATLEKHLWDVRAKTGILVNRQEDCKDLHQSLNEWIINLAKVGFHLADS